MPGRKGNRFWPTIASKERAIDLMHNGACASGLTALITAVFGVISVILGHPILGMDAWGFIDAAIFAVVAWRVFRLSLPWAITGLLLFSAEKVAAFVTDPASSGIVVGIIFWFFYLHAVRGGLFLRKIREAPPVESQIVSTPIE
jgi:hypothetical protein